MDSDLHDALGFIKSVAARVQRKLGPVVEFDELVAPTGLAYCLDHHLVLTAHFVNGQTAGDDHAHAVGEGHPACRLASVFVVDDKIRVRLHRLAG